MVATDTAAGTLQPSTLVCGARIRVQSELRGSGGWHGGEGCGAAIERNFRYTTMLSGGDVRTFMYLAHKREYGDVEMQKEECRQTPQHCLAQVGGIWEEGWRHVWRQYVW